MISGRPHHGSGKGESNGGGWHPRLFLARPMLRGSASQEQSVEIVLGHMAVLTAILKQEIGQCCGDHAVLVPAWVVSDEAAHSLEQQLGHFSLKADAGAGELAADRLRNAAVSTEDFGIRSYMVHAEHRLMIGWSSRPQFGTSVKTPLTGARSPGLRLRHTPATGLLRHPRRLRLPFLPPSGSVKTGVSKWCQSPGSPEGDPRRLPAVEKAAANGGKRGRDGEIRHRSASVITWVSRDSLRLKTGESLDFARISSAFSWTGQGASRPRRGAGAACAGPGDGRCGGRADGGVPAAVHRRHGWGQGRVRPPGLHRGRGLGRD